MMRCAWAVIIEHLLPSWNR